MHGCMWLHARSCRIGRELCKRGTSCARHAVDAGGVFRQLEVEMSLTNMRKPIATMVISQSGLISCEHSAQEITPRIRAGTWTNGFNWTVEVRRGLLQERTGTSLARSHKCPADLRGNVNHVATAIYGSSISYINMYSILHECVTCMVLLSQAYTTPGAEPNDGRIEMLVCD